MSNIIEWFYHTLAIKWTARLSYTKSRVVQLKSSGELYLFFQCTKMHIWAGKVLWRVEQVEFRTSSSVSPVIYLVRVATSANNSRMQLSMHYLHSNIFNWAGQPAKRRQNWAGKLHGFLAYLFSTLQINQSTSPQSKRVRAWYLPSLKAGVISYYIFKKNFECFFKIQ